MATGSNQGFRLEWLSKRRKLQKSNDSVIKKFLKAKQEDIDELLENIRELEAEAQKHNITPLELINRIGKIKEAWRTSLAVVHGYPVAAGNFYFRQVSFFGFCL